MKRAINLPFGKRKPPSENVISRAADPYVVAITISREREAIDRKRPIPIWCTENSKSM